MVKQKRKKRNILRVIITVLILSVVMCIVGYFAYNRWLYYSYPKKYSEYVEKYAKEYNVSENFVYAVIKTESGFKSDAVSDVGARGLMQIMETTFDWIKFKCDDENAVFYDMYNPEDNIRYGCWLLGYLYDEFGSIETAAAAYHAGRGNVNEWLSDKRYSSDGVTLEEIPIPDTAHYVEKITKAVEIYTRLYDK